MNYFTLWVLLGYSLFTRKPPPFSQKEKVGFYDSQNIQIKNKEKYCNFALKRGTKAQKMTLPEIYSWFGSLCVYSTQVRFVCLNVFWNYSAFMCPKTLVINLNLKIGSTNNCLPTLRQVLKTGIDSTSGLSKLSQIGDLPIEGPEAQSMELLCLVSHPTYDSGLDPGKYRNIFKGERGSRECFFWNAGLNESSITSRSR